MKRYVKVNDTPFVIVSKDHNDLPDLRGMHDYSKMYEVRVGDENGRIAFYLGKGHKHPPAAKEVVGWYANREMWYSYEDTLVATIESLVNEAWKYIPEQPQMKPQQG